MTIPGGGDLQHGRVGQKALLEESSPSGIPMDPIAPVWVHMPPAARQAYERLHGSQPPGYQGMGSVEWFARRHPDTGLCACGAMTDRWELRNTFLGGLPGYWRQLAICGWHIPLCADCSRRESIAALEKRQMNPALSPSVKASEAVYLAELRPGRRKDDAENLDFDVEDDDEDEPEYDDEAPLFNPEESGR